MQTLTGMKQNCHHKIKQQFYAVRERGKETAEVLSMQDGKTKIN
jgi:predicted GNAT family acetyltransferase